MGVTKGYTNVESVVLPSKGMVYKVPVNPVIELRSMTVEEEQRRQAPTENPERVMCEIIEACMIEKPAIHVYDMCFGDYQYLTHRLRAVTYGPDYRMELICPNCKEKMPMKADLDSIQVNEYDESFEEAKVIKLPVSGTEITLQLTTPRMLDEIKARVRDLKRKNPEMINPTYKLSLQKMIGEIDGKVPSDLEREQFVNKLVMKDANYLAQKAARFNGKVGLDTKITAKCPSCGWEFDTSFRFGEEFFRPTVD